MRYLNHRSLAIAARTGIPPRRGSGPNAMLIKSPVFQLIHLRRAGALTIGGLALLTGLYAWQKPFREYPGVEYSHYPIPPGPDEPTEWVFARLMYPPVPPRNGGFEFLGSWKDGG